MTEDTNKIHRKSANLRELRPVSAQNNAKRVLTAGVGVVQDDLRYSDFWFPLLSNGPDHFRYGDEIEVRANDRSWIADCRVISASRVHLDVKVVRVFGTEATAEPAIDDGTYTCRNEGGPHPWRVIRNADGHQMGQYDTKSKALAARELLYPVNPRTGARAA